MARDQLLEEGIWFANGAPFDEECMRAGRISGGNALKAAESLAREDWLDIREHVFCWQAEAKERAVNDVLISSESLLHPLSFGANLSRLGSELMDARFRTVEFLLILRNPVDQLVSLYKHRAKRGTAGDIQDWFESGYSLSQRACRIAQPNATI